MIQHRAPGGYFFTTLPRTIKSKLSTHKYSVLHLSVLYLRMNGFT